MPRLSSGTPRRCFAMESVDLQLAVLLQPQDGRGGELLGDRRDLEQGVRRVGPLGVVRLAVALREQDLAASAPRARRPRSRPAPPSRPPGRASVRGCRSRPRPRRRGLPERAARGPRAGPAESGGKSSWRHCARPARPACQDLARSRRTGPEGRRPVAAGVGGAAQSGIRPGPRRRGVRIHGPTRRRRPPARGGLVRRRIPSCPAHEQAPASSGSASPSGDSRSPWPPRSSCPRPWRRRATIRPPPAPAPLRELPPKQDLGTRLVPGGPRIGREAMWPAPTAEDWAKPCLLTWQRTWDDAVAVAKETGKPILICINMDGEIASEHYAGVRYRQPEIAKIYEPYVKVIASVYRHNPRDYDDEGNRIPCPRFGGVTCGEHIWIEPVIYEKFCDGKRIAPRHIAVNLQDEEAYDVYYTDDTALVFDAVQEGLGKFPPAKPDIVRGDRPLTERVASRAVQDRSAVEQAYQDGDAPTRAALLDAAIAHPESAPLDLLRMAIFGLDVDQSRKARQALAQSESAGATELISESLRVPMDAAERDALIAALKRLGKDSKLARWLGVVHEGLAGTPSDVDVRGWPKDADLEALALEARKQYESGLTWRVEERALAAEADPSDPLKRVQLAEDTLALAMDAPNSHAFNERMARLFARQLFADARAAAEAAAGLGAPGVAGEHRPRPRRVLRRPARGGLRAGRRGGAGDARRGLHVELDGHPDDLRGVALAGDQGRREGQGGLAGPVARRRARRLHGPPPPSSRHRRAGGLALRDARVARRRGPRRSASCARASTASATRRLLHAQFRQRMLRLRGPAGPGGGLRADARGARGPRASGHVRGLCVGGRGRGPPPAHAVRARPTRPTIARRRLVRAGDPGPRGEPGVRGPGHRPGARRSGPRRVPAGRRRPGPRHDRRVVRARSRRPRGRATAWA